MHDWNLIKAWGLKPQLPSRTSTNSPIDKCSCVCFHIETIKSRRPCNNPVLSSGIIRSLLPAVYWTAMNPLCQLLIKTVSQEWLLSFRGYSGQSHTHGSLSPSTDCTLIPPSSFNFHLTSCPVMQSKRSFKESVIPLDHDQSFASQPFGNQRH